MEAPWGVAYPGPDRPVRVSKQRVKVDDASRSILTSAGNMLMDRPCSARVIGRFWSNACISYANFCWCLRQGHRMSARARRVLTFAPPGVHLHCCGGCLFLSPPEGWLGGVGHQRLSARAAGKKESVWGRRPGGGVGRLNRVGLDLGLQVGFAIHKVLWAP